MSDSMIAAEGVAVAITTRCPSCGHQTLFVGSGGHLTCSWIQCKNPSIADALQRYDAIEQALAMFADNAGGYDKSLVRFAALAIRRSEMYDRDYIASELLRIETHARTLLASPLAADAVRRSNES